VFSNCPELHNPDLEIRTAWQDHTGKGDRPYFHFSGANDGDYWFFLFDYPLFPTHRRSALNGEAIIAASSAGGSRRVDRVSCAAVCETLSGFIAAEATSVFALCSWNPEKKTCFPLTGFCDPEYNQDQENAAISGSALGVVEWGQRGWV